MFAKNRYLCRSTRPKNVCAQKCKLPFTTRRSRSILIVFQPALEFLESAHMLWDNTVNKAYRVKGEIQPLQNAAADGVRKDIGAFGEQVNRPIIISELSPFG